MNQDFEPKSMKDLIAKRDYYKSLLEEGDPDDYYVKSLYQLYSWSVDVNQIEIPKEITPCKRVLKIQKILPLNEVRVEHPELLQFGGIFVIAEGIAIPHEEMKKRGFYKRWMDTHGLPQEYEYSTIKDLGDYGFALKKSQLVDFMTKATCWEFFDLRY